MEANTRRALLAGLPMLALAAACGKKVKESPGEVLALGRSKVVPEDPADPAWDDAVQHRAPLIPQDMVEPRLLVPTTPEVRVRAFADGTAIAFRLEWDDETPSDEVAPARFADACAVQFPVWAGADLPAPQMGERSRRVEIVHWRACWQATCDGRRTDTIQDLYPNASIDHHPFDAASLPIGSDARREMAMRYAPARALGNNMAGPRDRPVQDLVAEGPGTITPAPQQTSRGRGVRTKTGWSVVLVRRQPQGLDPVQRTQVAFAVWQGAKQEVGPRKMRTGWVPLALQVQA